MVYLCQNFWDFKIFNNKFKFNNKIIKNKKVNQDDKNNKLKKKSKLVINKIQPLYLMVIY